MLTKKYYLLAFLLLFIAAGCSEQPGKEDTKNPTGEEGKNDPVEKELLELGDVTGQVELLGNPLSIKYPDGKPAVYARNVWDMHAYGNKIYFGGGNSSNEGPAPNAGKAELWSYDIASQDFIKEFTVDDEQIHRIREFDGQLYIPGHDATQSWDLGNFYRLEDGTWKKYRTIPNAIHVYDIYKWDGKLFAAIGPQSPSKNVQVSYDDGLSWVDAEYICEYKYPNTSRVYTMFPLGGSLFVSYYNCPFIYTGTDNVFNQISNWTIGTALFDGLPGYRIERPVVFGEYTVYIVGVTDNDHQYLPLGLRYAKDHENVLRPELPENTLPRDILQIDDKYLIVLLSEEKETGEYYNTVMLTSGITSEGMEWKELFGFTADTFARSFEYSGGSFYFGLGCETTDLVPATGNILKFDYEL